MKSWLAAGSGSVLSRIYGSSWFHIPSPSEYSGHYPQYKMIYPTSSSYQPKKKTRLDNIQYNIITLSSLTSLDNG